MPDKCIMTHDQAVDLLIHEYKKADKLKYTNIFLANIALKKVDIGLPVLSAMRNFKVHYFSYLDYPKTDDPIKNDMLEAREWKKPLLEQTFIEFPKMAKDLQEEILRNGKTTPCHICSTVYEAEFPPAERRLTLLPRNLYFMVAYLQKANQNHTDLAVPAESLEFIHKTVEVFQTAPPKENIRSIFKAIRKKPPFNTWDADNLKLFLEALGWLGILHTEKYKGAFYEYYNYGIPPRKSHNSDWGYPVDFWQTTDGVDISAYEYWFGKYR